MVEKDCGHNNIIRVVVKVVETPPILKHTLTEFRKVIDGGTDLAVFRCGSDGNSSSSSEDESSSDDNNNGVNGEGERIELRSYNGPGKVKAGSEKEVIKPKGKAYGKDTPAPPRYEFDDESED